MDIEKKLIADNITNSISSENSNILQKNEIQVKLINSNSDISEKAKKEEVLEILKSIAPGTSLRAGIEGVLKAKTGAIIIVENNSIQTLFEGGFKVNCRFTPQRLIELC